MTRRTIALTKVSASLYDVLKAHADREHRSVANFITAELYRLYGNESETSTEEKGSEENGH